MYLFTYGTLQDSHVQHKLLERLLIGIPDSVVGFYQTVWQDEGYAYPMLIARPTLKGGEPIVGTTYEIEDKDLPILDEYEGNAYRRIRVTTERGLTAYVYIQNY